MPHATPEARRAYQVIWYRRNRDKHLKRSAIRYRKHRTERLAQQAAYERTAQGMVARIRSNAKRRAR